MSYHAEDEWGEMSMLGEELKLGHRVLLDGFFRTIEAVGEQGVRCGDRWYDVEPGASYRVMGLLRAGMTRHR